MTVDVKDRELFEAVGLMHIERGINGTNRDA
jgi:hypothetical protein